MKLQISENKIIDFSIANDIGYTISFADECPLGNNYFVINIVDEKCTELLSYYNDNEIEFYHYNNVLYVYFFKDNYCFYLLNLPEEVISQLLNKNQVVFTIEENEVEYFISYDKIFK